MSRMTRLVVVFLVMVVGPVHAADWPAPRLVADLSSVNTFDGFGPPAEFTALGDFVYFYGRDGIHGKELWRTDFTADGTQLVADLCPGNCDSAWGGPITVWNDTLYFIADDGSRGRNLWRSDGTREGTTLVRDFAPGRRVGACTYPVAVDSFLLLAADDGVHGCELWRSDGTTAGTYALGDIVPGDNPAEDGPKAIRRLQPGLALFGAGDALWRTDGTEAGTELLTAVALSHGISTVFRSQAPKVFDGIYYFRGDDGTHGAEPWASDGTPGGTELLVDSYPGPLSDNGRDPFLKLDGLVYFASGGPGGPSIWKSTGTAASTEAVYGPANGDPELYPSLLNVAGSWLFFRGSTAGTGRELWVSDGTAEGTQLVLDIDGSGGALDWILPEQTAALEDRLIFWADDGTVGPEPWISDGSPGGTQLLADLATGEWGSLGYYPYPAVQSLGDRVAFFASDNDPTGYWNPWTTDGTLAGTQRVTQIDQQTSAFPTHRLGTVAIGAVGRRALFIAIEDTFDFELFTSDGRATGTHSLDPFGPEESPEVWTTRPLPTAGGRVLFSTAGPANGLWASDGTVEGSVQLRSGSPHFELEPFAGTVLATVDAEVIQTDGTLAGTRVLTGLTWLTEAADSGGQGLLRGSSPSDAAVWFLGPGDAQPEFLLDLAGNGTADGMAAATIDGAFLGVFLADVGSGPHLYASDGTVPGTTTLAALQPCPSAPTADLPRSDARAMVFRGGWFYFCADDGVHGPEPWVSDGTSDGTHLLADLDPGPTGSYPDGFVSLEDAILFVAQTPATGRELWRSGGPLGAVLVQDLVPGPSASLPRSPTVRGNTLFFTAFTPEHGVELRAYTEGTAGPTIDPINPIGPINPITLVHDIHPGAGSASPVGLVLSNDLLWFAASDGEHGFELWTLDLNGLFADGFESGSTGAWSSAQP